MLRAGSTPLLDYWVAGRPIPGEVESGDQYLVAPFPDGVLVSVIDGLGHGPEAAAAAMQAATVMAQHAAEPVAELVKRCHEKLRRMRGVVMSLASFDAVAGTLRWLGVGNVECMLLRADAPPDAKRDSALLRGGIVGDRLPPLREMVVPVRPGDLLVLATDGIASAFIRDLRYPEHPDQLISDLFHQYARQNDDALILGGQWTGGAKATNGEPA